VAAAHLLDTASTDWGTGVNERVEEAKTTEDQTNFSTTRIYHHRSQPISLQPNELMTDRTRETETET
jgi:hypothetical protein